jgi:anti-sigma B factor antagonist
MRLKIDQREDMAIISVDATRIDAAVAIRFKEEMRGAIDTTTGPLVLDLGWVEFIDSSGLGAIVAALKLMPEDRALSLASLTPTVDKVFRMTRMDSIFVIHDTVHSAVAAE